MLEAYIPTPEQTAQELQAMAVFVTGGTVNTTVSFSGTIDANIGSVKIEDQAGNFAEVPAANTVKNGGNKALVVQQIDETGATLRQSTQVAIVNNQGTQATSALQTASNLIAAVNMNSLGTLATESNQRSTNALLLAVYTQGTTVGGLGPDLLATASTSAKQDASNILLGAIYNGQGTAATTTLQTTGNTILTNINSAVTSILNNQGTQATAGQATATGLSVVANNQGTQATSALQVTANSFLLAIDTNQATSALQTTGNASLASIAAGQAAATSALTAILNSQGTQATSEGVAVISNNQGTQATNALQLVGNAIATVVMNDMGTLATAAGQSQGNATQVAVMNNQGTQATSALQTTGNAALTVVMNTQGTQATAAAQATGNSTLTAIANNQGTQATSANQVTSNAFLLTLATSDPLKATAANQAAQLAQDASTIRTYGASGTLPAAQNSVLVALDPSAVSTDAFGRLRISSPDYRFDGQLTYNIPTDLWDLAFNSSGTVTYDSTNRTALITCAANGTSVLQGHKYAPYTPGRSQLAVLSFVMGSTPPFGTARRAGYYDGSNGVYLEQTPNGINLVLASTTANGNQTVAQTAWNIDKLNGTGPSGITLDLTKVQILAISLQALYAGRVIIGFDIDGILWPVHQFTHANKTTTPYIANASLPVRYESRSTGSNTTSFNALCASVVSEGGGALAQIPGRTFSAARSSTVSISTRAPVISIRANKFFNSIANTGIILPNTFGAFSSAQAILIELVRNPTLTGASWSNVDNNSLAQSDVSASAMSGGSTVFSTYVGSGGAAAASIPLSENLLNRLIIAYSQLSDSADILTLAATSTAGATNVLGSLIWKEIR